MRYIPTSASKVEQLKKQAKRLQRTGGGKHTDLLDRVAKGAGYDHWHHVTKCLDAAHDLEGLALLRREIGDFQKLALKGGSRVSVTDSDMLAQPMILFAAEGDAWLLDPHQQECMCLAFHGELIEPVIRDRGSEVELQFHGSYRIDDDAMHFDTALPQIGSRTVRGFPIEELRQATMRATESFEDKFDSVVLQADAIDLTPDLINQLLERGFGDFDRRELEQHAKDGARYSPKRNSLLYPPMTEGRSRSTRAARPPHLSDSVRWEVVGDLSAHPKSAAVLDVLAAVRDDYQDMGGNDMVLVLEAVARQPIIRATTSGLGSFMALVAGLQKLGLSDRLVDSAQPDQGVDAAFG
jgi:hypothetical protein